MSKWRQPGELLTERQKEVLALAFEGKSSREIAALLYVSKRTIDFHLAEVFEALGVSNRMQALRECERRGIDLSEVTL